MIRSIVVLLTGHVVDHWRSYMARYDPSRAGRKKLIRRGRRGVKCDKVNSLRRASFFFDDDDNDSMSRKGSKMSLTADVKSAVLFLNRFRCLGIEPLTLK